MNKVIFISIFVFFTSLVFAKDTESRIDLMYSGMKFSIPSEHVAIGSMGGNENFLVFRYDNQLGKKYIAFTTVNNDSQVDYQCKNSVFYSDVFNANENSICNPEQINAFRKVFLSDGDYGKWVNDDFNSFFTIKGSEVFLFILYKEKVIKIDSDFITKKDLKQIIQHYL